MRGSENHPSACSSSLLANLKCGRELTLTVALAFVDRFIPNAQAYFARKAEIQAALERHLASAPGTLECIVICVNMLDDAAGGGDLPHRAGDVGRGRRWRAGWAREPGQRPDRAESPDEHRGGGWEELGVCEAYIWLGSRIGQPVDQPEIAAAQLILELGASASCQGFGESRQADRAQTSGVLRAGR